MNFLSLFRQTLTQMNHNDSWIAGITLAIPSWIMKQHDLLPNQYHDVLILALLIVIVMDWAAGTALARKSPKVIKQSNTAIDSLIRDFMIVLCVFLAYLLDFELQSGSLIFAVFCGAFIWQNFISVMANIYVLGWEKYFPMWLVKLISNEITHKIKKYLDGDK